MILFGTYVLLRISCRFDLQLEDFGVDPDEYKDVETTCIFNAFVEPWEEECHSKNDCVVERFLTKYGGIRMYLPDTNPVNVIPTLNCQFYLRKHYCWMLIGEDENDYLEPFSPV